MHTHTRTNLQVMTAALLVGFLGNLLLRGQPVGVNLFFWATALSAAALSLYGWKSRSYSKMTVGFLLLAPLFAVGCFIWDSQSLRRVDCAAMAGCLLLAVSSRGPWRYWQTRLRDAFKALIAASVQSIGETFLAPRRCHEELKNHDARPFTGAVIRVILLAAPLLLLFGYLFFNADESFRQLVRMFPSMPLEDALAHTVSTIFFTILSLFVCVHFVRPAIAYAESTDPKPWLRPVEAVVILLLINILFLTFVALQLGHMFRGMASLQQTAGLTYANYAREGFFELLVVAGITVAELLFVEFLLGGAPNAKRPFQILAGIQVGLACVILGSAVHRLALYVSVYGLTVARVWGLAGIAWVAFTMGWLIFTLFRGQSERFFGGAVMAGLTVILALNIANPVSLTAAVNLSPSRAEKPQDWGYIATLGADAVPALARCMGELTDDQREYLLRRWERQPWSQRPDNLRSMNVSRFRARAAVSTATGDNTWWGDKSDNGKRSGVRTDPARARGDRSRPLPQSTGDGGGDG